MSHRRSPRAFGAGADRNASGFLQAPLSNRGCPRSPAESWDHQAGDRPSMNACQLSASEVREKLNRSSFLQDRGVYERAEREQSWKVSELKLSKLPDTADERSLSQICKAFGHQVVRVNTGWDPIKCSISEGKASLILRSGASDKKTEDLTSFLKSNLGCTVR